MMITKTLFFGVISLGSNNVRIHLRTEVDIVRHAFHLSGIHDHEEHSFISSASFGMCIANE